MPDGHLLPREVTPLTGLKLVLRVAVVALGIALPTTAAEVAARRSEPDGFVYVADLGYARPPGWDGPGWVEGAGLRPKRDGVRRVVCVGDSVTEGVGVTGAEAWPAQLGTLLGEDRTEVLNFGVVGWDARQVATLVETRIADWEPDVVVWGAYANDLFPSTMIFGARDGRPRWVAPDPPLAGVGLPPAVARWLIPRSTAFRLVLPALFVRSEAANRLQPRGAPWLAAQVTRLRAWSQRTHTPVVVLLLPPHVLASPCQTAGPCRVLAEWHESVRGVVATSGLPWVDALDGIRGKGPFFREGSLDPDHPNAAAHHLFAESVAPAVDSAFTTRQ